MRDSIGLVYIVLVALVWISGFITGASWYRRRARKLSAATLSKAWIRKRIDAAAKVLARYLGKPETVEALNTAIRDRDNKAGLHRHIGIRAVLRREFRVE